MLNAFFEIDKGDALSVETHEVSLERRNQHPKSLNTNYRRKIAMEIDQENQRLSNAIVGAKLAVPKHDDFREMGKQEFLQYQISKHTKQSTISKVDARLNFLRTKMNALPKIDCGVSQSPTNLSKISQLSSGLKSK